MSTKQCADVAKHCNDRKQAAKLVQVRQRTLTEPFIGLSPGQTRSGTTPGNLHTQHLHPEYGSAAHTNCYNLRQRMFFSASKMSAYGLKICRPLLKTGRQ